MKLSKFAIDKILLALLFAFFLCIDQCYAQEKAVFSYNCLEMQMLYEDNIYSSSCAEGFGLIDLNNNNTMDFEDANNLYISLDFGLRERINRTHTGIDIAIKQEHLVDDIKKMGYAVFTPVTGTITAKGYANDGYGYRVILYNSGFYYIFAHLLGSKMQSNPPVKIGDAVKPGDIIGYFGGCEGEIDGECPFDLNGNSTGPHLHFEIKKCNEDGSSVVQDPLAGILLADGTVCKWFEK